MSTNYKISICVICMNRLHHLRQTILQNIIDNEDYDDIEYILLDYNSSDGMGDWVKENLYSYIRDGKLIYYRTDEPDSWNPSHSKNLGFKLSSGDIICNIWADYFTGKGFAQYVNDAFMKDTEIVLTPIDFPRTDFDFNPPKDVLGKVCVKKSDFLSIGGFDEKMNQHGFEDYDFVMRLTKFNIKPFLIKDLNFLSYVLHNDEERYDVSKEIIRNVFVLHLNPWISELIILFKDGKYKKGKLIDCASMDADKIVYSYLKRSYLFEYTLISDWESGSWESSDQYTLSLTCSQITKHLLFVYKEQSQPILKDSDLLYYEITNDEIKTDLLVFNHFYQTRSLFEKNILNGTVKVNNLNFGAATVQKNFNALTIEIK